MPRGRGGRGGATGRGGEARGASLLNAENIQSVLDRMGETGPIIEPIPPAATAAESAVFDDALHVVVSSGRPTTQEECGEYVSLVVALIRAAGDSVDNWKEMVLALVRRRYHSRAPAAVAAAAGSAAAGAANEADGAGDGERLLFYLAIRVMQAASLEEYPQASKAAAVLPLFLFPSSSHSFPLENKRLKISRERLKHLAFLLHMQ